MRSRYLNSLSAESIFALWMAWAPGEGLLCESHGSHTQFDFDEKRLALQALQD